VIEGISALLHPTPPGLYCEAGDFYVDPVRAVPRAVITHGHADHARAGHGAVLATPATLAIMAHRMGTNFAGTTQALDYGTCLSIGGVVISLHPAGHVLGSAQVRIDAQGLCAVVSGDYKRALDPTCALFEPIKCDVFVTEATFGLPVFRHPLARDEIARLVASHLLFPTRAHVVGAYSLGKAQRVIAELRAAGYDRPIYLHQAVAGICTLYQAFGVNLGQLLPVPATKTRSLAGEIIIAPPTALNAAWINRFADPVASFASGWMRVRARVRAQGVELPLIISDHADWDELLATLNELKPRETWVTHGNEDALVRAAALAGLTAKPLYLAGYDDADADAVIDQAP
jgi:putative mRNA 3-end processing factor